MKRKFFPGATAIFATVAAIVLLWNGFMPPETYGQKKFRLVKRHLYKLNPKKDDFKLIRKWKDLSVPVGAGKLLTQVPVTRVDYSDTVTFRHNQDHWGGCFHYAALHIADILNEWEHPYTPDLSFRYLEYWGTVRFNQMSPGERERWAQQWSLGEDGVCSEANLFSNYDASKIIKTGKDADNDGNEDMAWDHALFRGDTPKPSPANDAEAKLYRVKMSVDFQPSANAIRSFLCQYGPVWASGPFPQSLGLKPGEGHVIAIVGFDDQQRRFKCLNSWGAEWNGSGYFYLGYDQVSADLWSIRYIEDTPSDRTVGPYAYSARIRIRHAKRNSLTVRTGVKGKGAKVTWDRPNRKNLIDYSGELNIDVPLPDYAASHWPPSSRNNWYLEVTDGDKDGRSGVIEEFTLARLYKNPANRSIGRFQVETFRPGSGGLPRTAPDMGTVSVDVPGPGTAAAKKTLRWTRLVSLAMALTLKADRYNVPAGTNVTLEAFLALRKPDGSSGNPLKGQKVTLVMRRVPRTAYRNKPEEYSAVQSATTGPDGKCRFQVTSRPLPTVYAAAVIDNSGKIKASAAWVTIGPLIK